MHPLVRIVALVTVYAAIACWWLWPLPTAARSHMLYAASDNALVDADVYLLLWILAWGSHAIAINPLGVFDANSFHPAPLSLAYSEHLLGQLPIFAPFHWTTDNPVLSANLLILTTLTLSGVGGYLLARRFTTPHAALLAGFVFAFYPERLRLLGHFHILAVAYLPLALFFFERWLDRARTRDLLACSTCLLAQMLCSVYLAYATLAVLAAYVPLALLRWRAALDRRRVRDLVVAGTVTGLLYVVTALPYLWMGRAGLLPEFGSEESPFAFGLLPTITGPRVREYLTGGSVGLAGILLAAVAVLWPSRRDRWPLILALALVFLGILLSLGPTVVVGSTAYASPYQILQRIVPGFGTIRMPYRFLFVAQLGMSLLVALGWQRRRRGHTRRLPMASGESRRSNPPVGCTRAPCIGCQSSAATAATPRTRQRTPTGLPAVYPAKKRCMTSWAPSTSAGS